MTAYGADRLFEEVTYVASWLEYQRVYGGHLGEQFSYMSYGVQGFFMDRDDIRFHGRDERLGVTSFYEGQTHGQRERAACA